MDARAYFIALPVGVLLLAACTEAFQRGARHRFPVWEEFVWQCVWIVGGAVATAWVVTLAFLALGRWG